MPSSAAEASIGSAANSTTGEAVSAFVVLLHANTINDPGPSSSCATRWARRTVHLRNRAKSWLFPSCLRPALAGSCGPSLEDITEEREVGEATPWQTAQS